MANLSHRRYSINADNKELEQSKRDIRQNIYISHCSYRLPFGKHRGKELCQVPLDYLNYIRAVSNNMDTVMRVAEEIERRSRLGARLRNSKQPSSPAPTCQHASDRSCH